MSDLLTVDEAATFLRMTPKAVRHAIATGQIPGVVRIGRRIRIRAQELRASLGCDNPVE